MPSFNYFHVWIFQPNEQFVHIYFYNFSKSDSQSPKIIKGKLLRRWPWIKMTWYTWSVVLRKTHSTFKFVISVASVQVWFQLASWRNCRMRRRKRRRRERTATAVTATARSEDLLVSGKTLFCCIFFNVAFW